MLAVQILILFGGILTAESYPWFDNRSPFEECLDVAIVGGGISGTYTGWRLRNRGLKIAIFENTNRIGGRMFSIFLPSVPNVPAELGAMRYIQGEHTTLESLLTKLDLQSEVFQPDLLNKVFHVRGERLGVQGLFSSDSPFKLKPGEPRNPRELAWRSAQLALNVTEPDQIEDIEEAVTADGVPLYKQGFMNVLGKVLSNEAREYLKTVIPFDTFFEANTNAVQRLAVRKPSSPPIHMRTVVGGMNAVSLRLADQFEKTSAWHSVRLNQRVNSIRKVWSGERYVYQLTIFETETVNGHTMDKYVNPHRLCANEVILALPHGALQNIQWYPLQMYPVMQTAFEAVMDIRAMKIFLTYPSAWWKNLTVFGDAFVTDLPLRQGVEFGRFWNSSGHETAMMMATYTDGKFDIDYWRELRNFPETISSSAVPAAYSVSTRVVEHVHHHLASVYDVDPSSIPRSLDGVMHIWDDKQNGGAWQEFKPGYKPTVVAKSVRQPSPPDRVFIVTNTFSLSMSAWSEGCLREADDILREFFNLS